MKLLRIGALLPQGNSLRHFNFWSLNTGFACCSQDLIEVGESDSLVGLSKRLLQTTTKRGRPTLRHILSTPVKLHKS